MRTHPISLLIVTLLAFASDARAARVLDQFDIDSLCAMSTLIVKAEVGKATDVHTIDGDCAVWEVTILSTLHGDAKPQSVIRVAGIEEYHKGPGLDGIDGGYPRLSSGDVVYLFLVPKGALGGYTKYSLTDADWKVIESGARLVAKDGVHSFAQYDPPGPSAGPVPGFVATTEKTFPQINPVPVEEFEKHVQTSLAFVSDLRHKLATNSLTESEKREILSGRAEVMKREMANSDYIPRIIYDEPRQPTTRPSHLQ